MHPSFPRIAGFSLVLTAVLISAGCSKSRGKIHGKVFLDDKPLAMGSVMFEDEEHQPHIGQIEADGSYEVTDVPYGVVKITVSCPEPVGRREAKERKKKSPEIMERFKGKKVDFDERPAGPKGDPEKWFPIPEQYTQVGNAKIEAKISEPVTKFDVVMKGPPPE